MYAIEARFFVSVKREFWKHKWTLALRYSGSKKLFEGEHLNEHVGKDNGGYEMVKVMDIDKE